MSYLLCFPQICFVALLSSAHSQTTSYAPCDFTMDLSNTYYTITCASPLTADQVLGAFSQTPINSNIRQLTIRNISGSNDDYMNQIINRIASSQYSLTILVLDQVNITTIPTGVKLFPNLTLLSLANNKLQSLSRGSLNVTSNLELIGLQNNNLTNIEPGTFEGKRLIITCQTRRKKKYQGRTYLWRVDLSLDANWSLAVIGLQSNQLFQFSSDVFQKPLESMVDSAGHIDLGGSEYSFIKSLAIFNKYSWVMQTQSAVIAVWPGFWETIAICCRQFVKECALEDWNSKTFPKMFLPTVKARNGHLFTKKKTLYSGHSGTTFETV